jgi:hypothetical protein
MHAFYTREFSRSELRAACDFAVQMKRIATASRNDRRNQTIASSTRNSRARAVGASSAPRDRQAKSIDFITFFHVGCDSTLDASQCSSAVLARSTDESAGRVSALCRHDRPPWSHIGTASSPCPSRQARPGARTSGRMASRSDPERERRRGLFLKSLSLIGGPLPGSLRAARRDQFHRSPLCSGSAMSISMATRSWTVPESCSPSARTPRRDARPRAVRRAPGRPSSVNLAAWDRLGSALLSKPRVRPRVFYRRERDVPPDPGG